MGTPELELPLREFLEEYETQTSSKPMLKASSMLEAYKRKRAT
jgi:hypothetical protein